MENLRPLKRRLVSLLAVLTLLLWVPTGVFGADHDDGSKGHAACWQSDAPLLSAAGDCPGADLVTGPHDHHVGVCDSDKKACPAPVSAPTELPSVTVIEQYVQAPRSVVRAPRLPPPALCPGCFALRV